MHLAIHPSRIISPSIYCKVRYPFYYLFFLVYSTHLLLYLLYLFYLSCFYILSIPLTILSLRWLWAVSGAMVRPKFNPGPGFGWVWVGFGRLWGVTGPILNPVLMMKAKFQPRPRLWLGWFGQGSSHLSEVFLFHVFFRICFFVWFLLYLLFSFRSFFFGCVCCWFVAIHRHGATSDLCQLPGFAKVSLKQNNVNTIQVQYFPKIFQNDKVII